MLVVKDEFPSISVTEQRDSLRDGIFFFDGVVTDDYGLTALDFNYSINSMNKKIKICIEF
mgnify:FL=1